MIDPEAISMAFTPIPDSGVIGVEVDGEAVLYHEHALTVHALNPTATVIWNCLDGEVSVGELCDDLAAAFSIQVETLQGDVVEAVREFGRQGLLEGVLPDEQAVAANRLTAPEATGPGRPGASSRE